MRLCVFWVLNGYTELYMLYVFFFNCSSVFFFFFFRGFAPWGGLAAWCLSWGDVQRGKSSRSLEVSGFAQVFLVWGGVVV